VTVWDEGPTGVQLAGLTASAAAAIYGFAVVHGQIGRTFSRRELDVMLRYGLPLVPSGAALWGLSLLDRLILVRLDDLDEVGIYGVANRIASVLLLGVVAFSTAYVPFFLSLHNENPDAERELRGRLLTYLAIGLFLPALAIGLFAEELIAVLAPGYGAAAPSAAILLLGIAAQGVGTVALAAISIARATKRIALHTATALVVNIALCFALIPPFGQLGAAIATAVAYALLSLLYFRDAQRLDRAPFEVRRTLSVLLVVGLALPFGFLPYGSEPVAVATKLAAFTAAVTLLWPLGVIGPMERDFLRQGLRRRRRPA
jgi:O-antigen/teichoic acid export membrane protein